MTPAMIALASWQGSPSAPHASDRIGPRVEAAQRDYKRLSGTWQLTRAIVDGRPVPEAQVKATVLITDGNTFRFPQASGVGTHPAGRAPSIRARCPTRSIPWPSVDPMPGR